MVAAMRAHGPVLEVMELPEARCASCHCRNLVGAPLIRLDHSLPSISLYWERLIGTVRSVQIATFICIIVASASFLKQHQLSMDLQ